jgi:hypothetical protein
MLAFGDKFLMGKPVTRPFDQFMPGIGPAPKQVAAK